MLLAIPFPPWLTPEIIPGFFIPLRWYSVGYLLAFGTAFLLYRKQIRERKFPMTEDDLSSLFLGGIFCLVLGARIFSTLVYETSDIYRMRPWLIFWPFHNGTFVGFQGMSYHGGVIGGISAILVYSKIKGYDHREIGDMFAASIPLGYTFGRLGNFANAELYGRVTTGPLGMIFPNAKQVPASETWVQEIAEKTNIEITGLTVNLPRHPSQLYEALLEGIVLWAIIWFFRNRKPYKGFLISLYLMGYGIFRFLVEYYRETDSTLGYAFEIVKTDLPTALAHPLLSFSTGQVLSFFMIMVGLIWLIIAKKLPNNTPIKVYSDVIDRPKTLTPEEKKEAQKNRRKLRKKLR